MINQYDFVDGKFDYQLRRRDFIPVGGIEEYDRRNGLDNKDIIPDSKAKLRHNFLSVYNGTVILGGLTAISLVVLISLNGLEKLIK